MFAAPCFAAIGAMKRELGNTKDTLFTVGFQTTLAYVLSFIVNQVGSLIFAGTKYTEKIHLDHSILEEASESVDVKGNLILYVIAGLIVVAVIGALIARLRQKSKYKKVA